MRECMWCDDCGLCRCDGGGCGLCVCVCVCVCCGWSPHRPGTLSEQNCLAGQQAGERLGGAEQKTSQGYIERIEYYSPVRPALSTLLFSVSGARKVQRAPGDSGAGGAQNREEKGEAGETDFGRWVYGAGAWLSFGLSFPTSPRCCCALNPGFLHAAVSSPVHFGQIRGGYAKGTGGWVADG